MKFKPGDRVQVWYPKNIRNHLWLHGNIGTFDFQHSEVCWINIENSVDTCVSGRIGVPDVRHNRGCAAVPCNAGGFVSHVVRENYLRRPPDARLRSGRNGQRLEAHGA